MRIAFFGSSLLSAYWNGAATYYRGMIKALHNYGHEITFYEPDAFGRQERRDLDSADYARSVVYEPTPQAARAALDRARDCDLIIKCSGVGVLDEFLETTALELQNPDRLVAFWDVDAPATLERVHSNPDDPFLKLIPDYDLILTYGGGPPVVRDYLALGARRCEPIYNAHDPDTHSPCPPDPRFACDLTFLGNRMPDRETRCREFFFRAARLAPDRRFLLGGAGWEGDPQLPPNVHAIGHVFTRDHNAILSSPLATLNINRDSMARVGYSPPTRIFEAAGAAACLITDAWEGIDLFFKPGTEILVAHDGEDVANILASLTPARARAIGSAARARALRDHTYSRRAERLLLILDETWSCRRAEGIA